jgi:hypothetical protein
MQSAPQFRALRKRDHFAAISCFGGVPGYGNLVTANGASALHFSCCKRQNSAEYHRDDRKHRKATSGCERLASEVMTGGSNCHGCAPPKWK